MIILITYVKVEHPLLFTFFFSFTCLSTCRQELRSTIRPTHTLILCQFIEIKESVHSRVHSIFNTSPVIQDEHESDDPWSSQSQSTFHSKSSLFYHQAWHIPNPRRWQISSSRYNTLSISCGIGSFQISVHWDTIPLGNTIARWWYSSWLEVIEERKSTGKNGVNKWMRVWWGCWLRSW